MQTALVTGAPSDIGRLPTHEFAFHRHPHAPACGARHSHDPLSAAGGEIGRLAVDVRGREKLHAHH